MIKTRFAPSPTGLMHLGNVRTALFNHCLAGREKGLFLLRIEATDRARDTGELKTRLELSGKALFLPLRAALTGRIDGPDLADLIALMPRERVREWFAALIKKP